MPLSILINLVTSTIELLRLAFFLSIPMFVCGIVIKFLNSKLSQKFGYSFFKSTIISTYLVVLSLIIVLYFFPLYLGYSESPWQTNGIPPQFQITLVDFFDATPAIAIKLLWVALVFTLFLIPLQFVASYIFELLKTKFTKHKIVNLYATVFLTSVITVLIILFIFPFIPYWSVYFLYFS
jgi:hypothetical protein